MIKVYTENDFIESETFNKDFGEMVMENSTDTDGEFRRFTAVGGFEMPEEEDMEDVPGKIYADMSTEWTHDYVTGVLDQKVVTVGKMIEALQKFDLDTPVCASGDNESLCRYVTGVLDNHRWGNSNAGVIIGISDLIIL